MLFSSIPGLDETKEKLVQAIQKNHLAHALLFHGPEGSANLLTALAVATYVNCENRGESDACGQCGSCQKMKKLIHPDLSFTFPLPGSLMKEDDEDKGKKVDILSPWRNFVLQFPYGNLQDWIYHNGFEKKQLNISKAAAKQIIRTVSLKSFEGGYKIILIWMPELLHTAAANALLKVLEEPPEKTLFLMVSTQPEKLLTTILSRTQKVLVRAYSDEEVKNNLIAEGLCSQEGARHIAPLANGNMREAYRLAEQVVDENTAKFGNWMRCCYSLSIESIVSLSDNFHTTDKEAQKGLLLTGLNILRECLLQRSQLEDLMRTPPEDKDFIKKFSLNALTENKIMHMYRLLNEAHYHLERNANAKIIFADLSFNLARVIRKKETA